MKNRVFAFYLIIIAIILSCNNETNDNFNNKTDSVYINKVDDSYSSKSEYTEEQIDSITKSLKGDFDTILFYFIKQKEIYFYVAKKKSQDPSIDFDRDSNNIKIGIITNNNKVIIPCQYDIIYSPNILGFDAFVVQNNKKFNIISLSGEKFFTTDVDCLYPVPYNNDTICQFRIGQKYGWLDKDKTTHIDNVKTIIGTMKYWSTENDILLERVYCHHCIKSYFLPPWYKEFGFEKTLLGKNEERYTFKTETVTEFNTFTFVIIALKEDVDGGCDIATYTKRILNVFNNSGEVIQQLELPEEYYYDIDLNSYYYRFVGDSILEVENSYNNWFYYKISKNGSLEKITTKRVYPFTKYSIMDDNYPVFNYAIEDTSIPLDQMPCNAPYQSYSGFSIEQYDYMRNEIFASYGYKFKSEKWQKEFSQLDWYTPLFDNVDDSLTDIEKKNIQYILNKTKELKQ